MAAAGAAGAQTNPYTDSLLRTVRALGRAVPGELPTAVRYLSVVDDSGPVSDAVKDGPKTRVSIITPVFQVRYTSGWLMVDAGENRADAGPDGVFYPDRYDQVLAALRGARLIVATHEHTDHVATVVHSPIAAEVAPKTLLTASQLHTLRVNPKVVGLALDSALATRYLVVDYQRVLPIAPGVVLIRSPGHTPGSQMVYVRLASGREILLAGDVAWLMAGIEMQRQKPDSAIRELGEDRAPIAQELAWLKNTVAPAGITVVVSHDGGAIADLARRGVLAAGLDVRSP